MAPLLGDVARRGSYLIVVTSDHGGHQRQHGTNHPEDFKLPLIMAADQTLPALAPGVFSITDLKGRVQSLLSVEAAER